MYCKKNYLILSVIVLNELLNYCMLGNSECILSSADFFQNQCFQKDLSGIPSVSKSLYPDQTQHFVGPDLGPQMFAKESADGTSG